MKLDKNKSSSVRYNDEIMRRIKKEFDLETVQEVFDYFVKQNFEIKITKKGGKDE